MCMLLLWTPLVPVPSETSMKQSQCSITGRQQRMLLPECVYRLCRTRPLQAGTLPHRAASQQLLCKLSFTSTHSRQGHIMTLASKPGRLQCLCQVCPTDSWTSLLRPGPPLTSFLQRFRSALAATSDRAGRSYLPDKL